MPALQGMPWPSASLTCLRLRDCHRRDDWIALTIPSLRELCLVNCNITGLVTLSSCSQLTKITMQGGLECGLFAWPGSSACELFLISICLAARVTRRGVCCGPSCVQRQLEGCRLLSSEDR